MLLVILPSPVLVSQFHVANSSICADMAQPAPKVDVPILKDLTIDNITENVIRINSQAEDARLKYILERLVTHLHDFARETRLNTDEWMKGIEFLTAVGKKCTDVRQVCCPPIPIPLIYHILTFHTRNSSSFPTPLASPSS